MPTTSRQTSATRTDTTSRLPINPGSTNKMYEPSTHNAEGEHADRKRCVMSINKNNPLADNAPTDHEDQALVMRTRSGDREALERLIERHQGWIYNIAVRMLYHPQDAEDAT